MPNDTKPMRDALIDERPLDLTRRDFRHEEVATAAGPSFVPIASASDIPFYELRDQDGSSSCMNQSYAKMRGIKIKQKVGTYVSLSGGFLYRRRTNSGPGMHLSEVFEFGKDLGLPFEAVDSSQKMSEEQIMAVNEIPYADDVAKVFTDPDERFFYLPPYNFDAIASVVSLGFPVAIMHFSDFPEYTIKPTPRNPNITLANAPIRHGVCAHLAIRWQNEDLLVMDDSWGILQSSAADPFQQSLKTRGQRILTREWVNSRVYGAAYIRDLKFKWDGQSIPPIPKPNHFFSFTLEWGLTNNSDVIELQNILKYEKMFPVDQPSTGNYFGMTMAGVQSFQKKYGIVSYGTPETTGYGRVGSKTRAKINALYGQ